MSEVEQKVTGPTDDPLLRVPLDQPWLGSLLRPTLIAVMIICLDVALLALVGRVSPALAGAYAQVVLLLSLVATLLGCVTTTWLAQPAYRHLRRPIYRLAEFLFLLVFTRLLLWLLFGSLPTLTALIYRPLAALFDGPYIVAALIIVLSWFFAGELTSELLRLALQPDELFALAEDRIGELVRTSNSDRPAVLQRFVANWVGGGVLMVLIAASMRLARPESNGFFAITRQNIDPTLITAIILYFLAGLLLISQGQLALLRTRWLIDRVPTSDTVLRNWPIYVFALLLVVALLATLLPFGGTFWLAQILFMVLTFIFNGIFAIFRFFMGLFLLLVALLTGESPPPPATEAPPPPPPPAFEALPQAASQLPAWTGGMIFWIVMAIFLSYAAYIYLNDKGVQFTWLRTFWQLLRARWALLTGAYQQWHQTRVHTQPGEGEESSQRGSWRNVGRQRGWQHLDPTQQVRYFYLKTLEQAKEKGLGRKIDETPARYGPRLATNFTEQPEQAQAIEELTTAFIQARYTQKATSAAQATRIEQLWQKFKRFLAEQS